MGTAQVWEGIYVAYHPDEKKFKKNVEKEYDELVKSDQRDNEKPISGTIGSSKGHTFLGFVTQSQITWLNNHRYDIYQKDFRAIKAMQPIVDTIKKTCSEKTDSLCVLAVKNDAKMIQINKYGKIGFTTPTPYVYPYVVKNCNKESYDGRRIDDLTFKTIADAKSHITKYNNQPYCKNPFITILKSRIDTKRTVSTKMQKHIATHFFGFVPS